MQRTLFAVCDKQATPWNYMYVLINIWKIGSQQILAPKCLISAFVHLIICVVGTEHCLHVVVCKLIDTLCISVLYVCMCVFLCCRGWSRRRCPYGRSWTVRWRSSLTLCTPRLSSNTCCSLWQVYGGSSCGPDTTVAGTPAWGPR